MADATVIYNEVDTAFHIQIARMPGNSLAATLKGLPGTRLLDNFRVRPLHNLPIALVHTRP